MRIRARLLAGLAAVAFAAIPAGAQQTGTITGVVRSNTGEPLSSAQVSIQGTGYGTLSQSNGRFVLSNVPAGSHTVRADLIGYATRTAAVTVAAGATANIELRLQPQAVELSAVVVTGVAGATQKVKLPFEVAQLRAADLPVPQPSPVSAIQGKVAGATVVSGSGRPGSAPSLLLRGPTSLNASGRSQEPLYIVDGVILSGSLIDIDALDIESIEVVKGAAAASLYGSRAGSGVVQIRTKRGANRENNQVRYTARSEVGTSELGHKPELLLTQAHQYKLQDGKFINANGTLCDWLECRNPQLAGQKAPAGQGANEWNTYQTQTWPGTTYNQVDRFFNSSTFLQNYVAADGRSGATNYHVSLSNLKDPGVMPGMRPFGRTNMRVNVDQNVLPTVQVQASAFYSRSTQGQFPESQGNPLFNLTRMPAGVDLLGRDPKDSTEMVLFVDPVNNESPNPLYEMYNRKYTEQHSRFLGSGNLRFSPLNWLSVEANGSFDRLDLSQEDLFPKGFRTITPSATLNNGRLFEYRQRNEAFNGSLTGTMRFTLSDRILNRTQLRYLYENQTFTSVNSSGYKFAVADVPTFNNIDQTTISAGSYDQTIRADGYFAITNFEISERYIIDALIRNDGSSLFGADQRRQWYYRAAGAWRVSQEPFFHLPGLIDELKLRYSVGTAGGRPSFASQYETYSVSGGRVTPVTLGNRDLRPEVSTEREAGIDAGLFNNIATLTINYSNANTKDQILPVPLPAYTGFSTQWRNAGEIKSNTWEASLDARLHESRNFSWAVKLLFDRTRSTISSLNVPAFQYGVAGQALGTVFYAREGERIGTFYGTHYATSCADLPAGVSCDGFKVNNDGLLVWTGASGSLDNPQWGTSSDVKIRGSAVKWGTPFAGECTDRSTNQRTLFCPVGNSMPDFSVSFSSNMNFHGIGLYALVNRVQGFSVYNQPLQWATFKRWSGIMDQRNVAEAQQKPLGYFDAMYGVSGLQPSNIFVEDGSFTKLREASVSYRFNSDQLTRVGLGRVHSIGVSLIGRNLLTWTNYRGFDPEVGKTGGETGSSALARVEGYQYPNFRTFTAAIDINF